MHGIKVHVISTIAIIGNLETIEKSIRQKHVLKYTPEDPKKKQKICLTKKLFLFYDKSMTHVLFLTKYCKMSEIKKTIFFVSKMQELENE